MTHPVMSKYLSVDNDLVIANGFHSCASFSIISSLSERKSLGGLAGGGSPAAAKAAIKMTKSRLEKRSRQNWDTRFYF
jgi:hypothetical protein